MELTLTRTAKRRTYTIGRLAIDGTYFCDTLEPTRRDIGPGRPGRKLPGRTAIPEGRYPVAVTFSPRFNRWLPLLLHVPMFTGVRIHAGNTAEDTARIHAGNTAEDTAGCILVGKNARPGMVLDSQIWLRRLLKRLAERPEGEGVWITVR